MIRLPFRLRRHLSLARSRCARVVAARKPKDLSHVHRWLDILAVQHVVRIDPARIAWRTSGGDIGRDAGKVWGNRRYLLSGNWDQCWRWPFDSEHQEGCRAVHDILAGRHYNRTDEYHNRINDRIAEGISPEQARTDMDHYYQRLLAVLDNIKSRGYRSQAELAGDPRDEIKVYVDREGELLIGDGGNHRLALAQLLALPSVPVLVNGVHRDFVAAHAGNSPYHFVTRTLPDVLVRPNAIGATATAMSSAGTAGLEAS